MINRKSPRTIESKMRQKRKVYIEQVANQYCNQPLRSFKQYDALHQIINKMYILRLSAVEFTLAQTINKLGTYLC
jgi:hypothetical protein